MRTSTVGNYVSKPITDFKKKKKKLFVVVIPKIAT